MAQSIRIKRTIQPNNPPLPGSLDVGELAVEMNRVVPRLWVGVPSAIDTDEQRLLVGDDIYLPLTGGRISGTPGSLVIGDPPGGDLGPGTLHTSDRVQINRNPAALPPPPP